MEIAEDVDFKFKLVNIDTLFKMREYLENEYKNMFDEDSENELLKDLQETIDLINSMCYHKIKKEQDIAYKNIDKIMKEIGDLPLEQPEIIQPQNNI